MLILNSRYRGIGKKTPLYRIQSCIVKWGIIVPLYIIQGNYPQKCSHSAMVTRTNPPAMTAPTAQENHSGEFAPSTATFVENMSAGTIIMTVIIVHVHQYPREVCSCSEKINFFHYLKKLYLPNDVVQVQALSRLLQKLWHQQSTVHICNQISYQQLRLLTSRGFRYYSDNLR